MSTEQDDLDVDFVELYARRHPDPAVETSPAMSDDDVFEDDDIWGEEPDDFYDNFAIFTPRSAAALYAGALHVQEYWQDYGGDIDDDEHPAHGYMPPATLPWIRNDAWRERFVACFERWADRIAQRSIRGQGTSVNTAEEMAWHVIVGFTKDHLDSFAVPNDADGTTWTQVEDLPGSTNMSIYDEIDSTLETVLEDWDVLLMFDIPGVEHNKVLNETLHMADLRSEAWFDPFNPARAISMTISDNNLPVSVDTIRSVLLTAAANNTPPDALTALECDAVRRIIPVLQGVRSDDSLISGVLVAAADGTPGRAKTNAEIELLETVAKDIYDARTVGHIEHVRGF